MIEAHYNRLALYYSDVIDKKPAFKNILRRYAEALDAQKSVRKLCGTDDLDEIKELVGKQHNSFDITEETFMNAKLVMKEYQECYELCKAELLSLTKIEEPIES